MRGRAKGTTIIRGHVCYCQVQGSPVCMISFLFLSVGRLSAKILGAYVRMRVRACSRTRTTAKRRETRKLYANNREGQKSKTPPG